MRPESRRGPEEVVRACASDKDITICSGAPELSAIDRSHWVKDGWHLLPGAPMSSVTASVATVGIP